MNRLEIAKAVNALAGTQGVVTTTEGVTGYQEVLLQFIDKGYREIQVYRKNWKFMQSFVQAALNGLDQVFEDADIALVDKVIYNKAELRQVPYEDWILRDHPSGPPSEYTISPLNGSIIFNLPDAPYIVDVYYWHVPDNMTLNVDVPVLPVQYHDIIIYKGCMGLGTYLGNYDLVNENQELYDIAMGQMLRTECPEMHVKTKPWVTGNNYHRRNWV